MRVFAKPGLDVVLLLKGSSGADLFGRLVKDDFAAKLGRGHDAKHFAEDLDFINPRRQQMIGV